jgi:hypothetical protein
MAEAYFTFCYNAIPGAKKRWGEEFRAPQISVEDLLACTHKYAFVVGTPVPELAFKDLSQESLFRRLLGPVLYGWSESGHLVIGSMPDMAPELLRANASSDLLVKTRTGAVMRLPIRELERMCISPIKYGMSCETCRKYSTEFSGECYLRQVLAYTKRQQLVSHAFVPADSVPADEFVPEDLDVFISKAVKNGHALSNGYKYISPKRTRAMLVCPPSERGSIPLLRYYDNHCVDVGRIETNQQEARQRSLNAAATKRNERRCREECIFAPCEHFHTKSYRSWVSSCWNDRVGGPFTEERVAEIYRNWLGRFTERRTNEEISYIAHNSGATTRIFGYEMILTGMDAELKRVEFTHPRGSHHHFFSYEDACEIMRTQWRNYKKTYEWMRVSPSPDVMTEEQLWTYAEIRQHNYAPGYSTYCGWADPRILAVTWCGSSFTLHAHCGRDYFVDDLKDIIKLFRFRNTIKRRA